MCRRLADQEQAYQPRLADALNGLALAKARIGCPDESAAAANEAVLLYRSLREAQPSTYRRRLASALTNHADAVRHSDADRAVALLTEARSLCDPTTDADLAEHVKTLLDALGHADDHDPPTSPD